MINMLDGASLLVSGGTGSFGNTIVQRLMKTEISEIRIFSRDEKKQDDMRRQYNCEKLKFYIGDVRDYASTLNAIRGVDYVFHSAALKQVPSCEFYPLEALKTNVFGTENILEAAISCNVRKVVCLSTDKAVYPINAMGISKALMEKVAIAKARNSSSTKISVTRYGNVIASRGSVIPRFFGQIASGSPITVTDPNMTRFMMSLDDAVDLVLFAFGSDETGTIFVQKSPAATLASLAEAIRILGNSPDHPIKIIGTRHGEKLAEVLLSREEMFRATDLGNYFSVPMDNRTLNYDNYFAKGNVEMSGMGEFTSERTKLLEVEELCALIKKSINSETPEM